MDVTGYIFARATRSLPFALVLAFFMGACGGTIQSLGGNAEDPPGDSETGENFSDADDSSTGFGGGGKVGVVWSSGQLQLDSSGMPTNNSALDPSWTPHYDEINGYWSFDGSIGTISSGITIPATIGDNGNSLSGTSLAYVDAKIGQGLNFNGGDAIDIGNYPYLDMGLLNYTVSFWVRGGNHGDVILAKENSGAPTDAGLLVYVESGSMYLSLQLGGPGGDLNLGSVCTEWCQITIVRRGVGSNQLTTYKNGIAGAVNTDARNLTNSESFTLGAFGSHSNGFNGELDEVAIWKGRALTDAEIGQIYARQSPRYAGIFQSRTIQGSASFTSWQHLTWKSPLPFFKELSTSSESSAHYSAISANMMLELRALWHLNESAATGGAYNDWADASGFANHAESSGGSAGSAGVFKNSVLMDGGHLRVASSASLNLDSDDERSVSMWIWPRTTGSDRMLIAKKDNNSAQRGWSLKRLADDTLQFEITSDDFLGTVLKVRSTATVAAQPWHHVAVSYDGSELAAGVRIFIDGVESATTVDDDGLTGTSVIVEDLRLGNSDANTDIYSGFMDEVALWGRELSPSEILSLYRRGSSRIRFQVRSCAVDFCSDQSALPDGGWHGPDNSSQSYFSELNNNSLPLTTLGNVLATLPKMLFSDFSSLSLSNGAYFQYRAILEADRLADGPALQSVIVNALP